MVSYYTINFDEIKEKKLRSYLEKNKMYHVFECNNEKIYFGFLSGGEFLNPKPNKTICYVNPNIGKCDLKRILDTVRKEEEKMMDFYKSLKFIFGAKPKKIGDKKVMSRFSALVNNPKTPEEEILNEIFYFLCSDETSEISDILLHLEEEKLVRIHKK